MNMLRIAIDLTGVIFEIIITHLMFFYLMRGRRTSKLCTNVVSIGLIIFMTAATCVENNVYVLPLVIFLSGFAISIMYRGKWGLRLFLSVLLLVLFTLTEMITGALLVFFAHIDMVDIRDNNVLYMVGVLASKLLVFLLVKIIGYKRLDIYRHISIKTFAGLLTFPLSSAFAMYVMSTHMRNYRGFGAMAVLLFASIFMITANIFTFYLYEKQLESEFESMKLAFAKKEIELQASYYKDINERQTIVQKLSHDMKNSLAGVLGLLENNEYAVALTKLRELSGAVYENTIVHTGYPAIDALLTTKHQTAQEKHIPMEIHVALPPEMQMDVLELCILLGNALDNALEASEKITDESKRSIYLNVFSYEKYLSIKLENATVDVDSENHSETTKPDRYLHGFGLGSIRAIANRHDGSVDIKHKNNLFSLTILTKYG